MSVTNITNLYFSSSNYTDDYYKFLVNQGDYQSRTIQANLYISKEKDRSPLPYSLTSEAVTVTYEYVNSNGETVNTAEFECAKATSIGDYVVTFLIPNVVVENYGIVRAQVKVYEDEYTLLNTSLFKFYVSESLSVGSIEDSVVPYFTRPILESGSPTTSTVGVVSQLYIDTDNDELYYCSNVSGEVYTWKPITELPQATETTLGGIKAAVKGIGDTIGVKIDETSGKLYVSSSGSEDWGLITETAT